MSSGKIIGYTILIFVGLFALSFGLELLGIYRFGFMETKREEVRREVWEETSSHIHGVTEQLGRYKSQYDLAKNETEKQIIKNSVKGQFGYLDDDVVEELPYTLQTFLRTCRGY